MTYNISYIKVCVLKSDNEQIDVQFMILCFLSILIFLLTPSKLSTEASAYVLSFTFTSSLLPLPFSQPHPCPSSRLLLPLHATFFGFPPPPNTSPFVFPFLLDITSSMNLFYSILVLPHVLCQRYQ